jgi:hypothetical protein
MYGIDRYDVLRMDDLLKEKISETRKYRTRYAGYFQLYFDKSKYYSSFSEDASKCDLHFANLFAKKQMIDSYVFHLGRQKLHWNGRTCREWNCKLSNKKQVYPKMN